MAILIADTKLETETDAWYMFYADTKEDIQTLPTSTSTGSSYRVRKYARPTSVAYCIEEARQYMLDSKDRWRAMCGLSDSVLDALSKSAAELLVICKDTENFRDEASKSAREALESKRAAEDAANSASKSSLAAASSERTATEKAEESSELAIRTEKNAELSKESSETAIKAAAEAKEALSMLSFAFGIDDEGRFSLFAKKSIT